MKSDRVDYLDCILDLIELRSQALVEIKLQQDLQKIKELFEQYDYKDKVISQLIKGELE